MKILVLDNYDSFTYNLYHFLGEQGAELEVVRNDEITVEEVLAKQPEGVILSPGPCTPNEAGICLEMVSVAAEENLPLLGVCLGHQSIGQALGGKVVRAQELMHGKVSSIVHKDKGLFAGLPSPLTVTRYHSLLVERSTLPECLEVTAEIESGMIMALQHRELPIHGVQFHPESIASEGGKALLKNFVDIAKAA